MPTSAQSAPMSLILRIGYRLSPRLGRVMRVMQTLLFRRGYWQSVTQQMPVDAQGGPLPWITYAAMDCLEGFDFSQAAVLEYGCGQSSLWWSQRAARVVSVERRAEWAARMRSAAPQNLEVLGPLEGHDYVHAPLHEGASYHVIVIDGHDRFECAQAALPHLQEGGILVLDNADWHRRTARWLRGQGLLQLDFHGPGPLNDYSWCTSLFIRASVAFPMRERTWSPAAYGSLEDDL